MYTSLNINVTSRRIEDRPIDSWFDMSLRSLRKGQVRFYQVNDSLTGKWLFKVCSDQNVHRIIVKALKCPPGSRFVQLEGRTMLFQKSLIKGYLYDVISLSYLDEEERLRRKIVDKIEDVPEIIKKKFKVSEYEEAVGKKAIGKKLVSLCEENDEKNMITLFLIQRAWPISQIPPEIGLKISDLMKIIKNLERAQLKDIYSKAEEKFQLNKDDVKIILGFLEDKGRINIFEEYVKTRS